MSDEEVVESYCPICLDPIDYCIGHGRLNTIPDGVVMSSGLFSRHRSNDDEFDHIVWFGGDLHFEEGWCTMYFDENEPDLWVLTPCKEQAPKKLDPNWPDPFGKAPESSPSDPY